MTWRGVMGRGHVTQVLLLACKVQVEVCTRHADHERRANALRADATDDIRKNHTYIRSHQRS